MVEDNLDSAEMTAELLRLHRFEVAVANGAHAALALVTTFLPEVALINIGLPEMDGYELARQIAGSASDCLLVAITGYGAERDRARASEAGFAGFLIKPVRAAAILAAILGEDAAAGAVRHRTADVDFATDEDDDDASLVPPTERNRDRR